MYTRIIKIKIRNINGVYSKFILHSTRLLDFNNVNRFNELFYRKFYNNFFSYNRSGIKWKRYKEFFSCNGYQENLLCF